MKDLLLMDKVVIDRHVDQEKHCRQTECADHAASSSERKRLVQAVAQIHVRILGDISSLYSVNAASVQVARSHPT